MAKRNTRHVYNNKDDDADDVETPVAVRATGRRLKVRTCRWKGGAVCCGAMTAIMLRISFSLVTKMLDPLAHLSSPKDFP